MVGESIMDDGRRMVEVVGLGNSQVDVGDKSEEREAF